MPSLEEVAASLAPAKITVPLGDTSIDIRGVSAGELSMIAQRFPVFGEFLNQSRAGTGGEAVPVGGEIPDDMAQRIARNIDMGGMLTIAGTVWPALIAAAVG